MRSALLEERVVGIRGHAARVLGGVEVHVSLIAPVSGPAVLDNDVRLVVGGDAVANGQHRVVQIRGGAARVGVDAVRVEGEGGLRSIDGDGDRAAGSQRLLERRHIAHRHVGVARDADRRVTLRRILVVAVPISAKVGSVLRRRSQAAAGHHPLEGLLHKATVAAIVAEQPAAVHQVLLGQHQQLASLEVQRPLQGAHRAERPARAAHCLILDRSHSALLAPVQGGRQVQAHSHVREVGAIVSRAVRLGPTQAAHLRASPIEHVVQSQLVAQVAAVHGVHQAQVVDECVVAVAASDFVRVGAAVLAGKVMEVVSRVIPVGKEAAEVMHRVRKGVLGVRAASAGSLRERATSHGGRRLEQVRVRRVLLVAHVVDHVLIVVRAQQAVVAEHGVAHRVAVRVGVEVVRVGAAVHVHHVLPVVHDDAIDVLLPRVGEVGEVRQNGRGARRSRNRETGQRGHLRHDLPRHARGDINDGRIHAPVVLDALPLVHRVVPNAQRFHDRRVRKAHGQVRLIRGAE
mmetsp:Transcript_15482/g.49419  ORF Transcript_15482/g.49419 Transcript_15482/m.49419 type:complete len:516 (+) Transcript_15482:67-1614(+)